MSWLFRRNLLIATGIAALGVAVILGNLRPATAQGFQRPKGPGDFHFQTKVGSFKILGIEAEPVHGHFDMSANGSLLVTGLDSPPKTTGTLKLEYTYLPLKKYAYHGRGSLIIDGSFTSLQWFGTDLVANFHGRGKVRLVGEFDKNLSTGTYWREDPKDTQFWPANSVIEQLIPPFAVEKPAETRPIQRDASAPKGS